jgi:hypothetical protein
MAQSSPASKYPFVDIQLGRRGKETGDVFDLETDHMQIEQRIGIVARRCGNDQGRETTAAADNEFQLLVVKIRMGPE